MSGGRSAAALVGKKHIDALFARFTPEMVHAVTKEQLRTSVDSLISEQAPLGKAVTESIREQGGGIRAYVGEYQWRVDRNLILTFAFAPVSKEKIVGMRIRPAVEREAAARNIGKSMTALIAARNAKGLVERFTPELAAKVTESALLGVLSTTLTEKAPLGALVREDIEAAEGDYLRYSAIHTWRKDAAQNLSVVIIFEAGGANRIAGLTLRPELPAVLPPDPKADYKQKTHLSLPFSPGDEWYIAWGGTTRSQNYHVDYPDQRHAFDIVMRKDGSTHTGDGKVNSDYYDWGKPIIAPASGTVVEAVNDVPDNLPGETDARHPAGNHVVLDFGNGEYALLAHLQKGSIRAKAGDSVTAGDVLGLCGNSGNTTEPHLHFHLQNRPTLFGEAIGLPVTFFDYMTNGEKVASGCPVKGQTIKKP